MTRINLKHKHTKYIDIQDLNKPKLNTLEYSLYISLLTGICITVLVGILVLGLYTLKLINSTPFYSIIAN